MLDIDFSMRVHLMALILCAWFVVLCLLKAVDNLKVKVLKSNYIEKCLKTELLTKYRRHNHLFNVINFSLVCTLTFLILDYHGGLDFLNDYEGLVINILKLILICVLPTYLFYWFRLETAINKKESDYTERVHNERVVIKYEKGKSIFMFLLLTLGKITILLLLF